MATLFIYLLGLYFLIGMIFSIWFVNRGASQLDEAAKAASWKLKLLWFPGAAALWPILIQRLRNI